MRRLFLLTLICCGLMVAPVHTDAAPTTVTSTGLQITPAQQELKVDAGLQKNGSLVVANLTNQTLDITLSAQKFSVTGLNYDYRFSKSDTPWIHLSETRLVLASQQSKTITVSLTPDMQATPGGYYYSIVTSTTIDQTGLPSTLQAISLLYVTINGNLVKTGEIKKVIAPRLVFTKQFDVSIDAKNTGNVYYFASVNGRVKGLFTGKSNSASSHLLIPDKTRRVTSSIKSPLMPGVYPLEVSYATDIGTTVRASQLIVCIPPWSIFVVLSIALLANIVIRQRKSGDDHREQPDD